MPPRKPKSSHFSYTSMSPSSPARASVPATPVAASSPVAERSELKGSGKPKAPVSPVRQITHDDVSRRAYEIYASRGYAPGDPVADWYEAERQLRAGL